MFAATPVHENHSRILRRIIAPRGLLCREEASCACDTSVAYPIGPCQADESLKWWLYVASYVTCRDKCSAGCWLAPVGSSFGCGDAQRVMVTMAHEGPGNRRVYPPICPLEFRICSPNAMSTAKFGGGSHQPANVMFQLKGEQA